MHPESAGAFPVGGAGLATTTMAAVHGAGLLGMARPLATTSHPVPTGPLYSILLVAHVLCALVGFGAMVLTAFQATRARQGPGAPGAPAVRRYFRPGPNVAGRFLYGVPLFGFGLLAASRGAFDTGDGFVVVGLGIWAVAVLVAESVVWPGERRIQALVTGRWGDPAVAADLERHCRRVLGAAAVLVVLFVAATVVMIGKP